jgi:NADH-quinone oxidoreductase subunit G
MSVKTVSLTIDGVAVTVPEGTLLVEAAKKIGTDVPVYCYHPKLGPAGLCRICLVDVEKTPKLQIACNTTVAEGMVVHTHGAKVEDGRRAVLEFLLLNHPLDCPICDKGGECDLQDFSMAYGQGASRLADPKGKKPKAIDLGPTIVLDDERCIVCQRCSRFDDIITQERSLVVMDRGQRDVIATATGEPYRSNFSGNVTELCPVGALTSKTYRFKSRPWDLNRTATTCTQCSVGCALNVDERFDEVLRTMSVPGDDAVSDGWLCDRGRYNVGFYSDRRRLTSPLLRVDGEWAQLTWDDAIEAWANALRGAREAGGAATIAALGGGRLTNEEAILYGLVMRALGSENVDWRVGRQRQASPGPGGGAYLDIETAQAILCVGRPPAQNAPVMSLRARKAVVKHGARLIVVGDHPVPRLAFGVERIARPSDLSSLGLDKLERIAVVWDGIDPQVGAELESALATYAANANVFRYVTGEQPNARGAEALGLLPRNGGLDTAAILDAARTGKIGCLSILGANPMLSTPGGAEAVRSALQNVSFVVVSELFMTATAERATLVLPACGPFEKSGHTYDLTGAVHRLHHAVAAPSGALSDEAMLIALASELEIAIPEPAELRRLAAAPPKMVAKSFGDPAICGEPKTRRGEGHGDATLRLVIDADAFSGGGTVWHDERIDPLRPLPSVALNARTAAAAEVCDGEIVDLVAGERTLAALQVRINEQCVDGTVVIVDGLPAAPASTFFDGESVAPANVRAALREEAIA